MFLVSIPIASSIARGVGGGYRGLTVAWRNVLCRKSLEKGWELLSIAITFFPPSNRFYSYLEGELPLIAFRAR